MKNDYRALKTLITQQLLLEVGIAICVLTILALEAISVIDALQKTPSI